MESVAESPQWLAIPIDGYLTSHECPATMGLTICLKENSPQWRLLFRAVASNDPILPVGRPSCVTIRASGVSQLWHGGGRRAQTHVRFFTRLKDCWTIQLSFSRAHLEQGREGSLKASHRN